MILQWIAHGSDEEASHVFVDVCALAAKRGNRYGNRGLHGAQTIHDLSKTVRSALVLRQRDRSGHLEALPWWVTGGARHSSSFASGFSRAAPGHADRRYVTKVRVL